MSLTNQEIMYDFQKLINHKVAKGEFVEPELYNALGLIQDLMKSSVEGLGDIKDAIPIEECKTDLHNDCKILIDSTEFQNTLLNIISDTDCSGSLVRYMSSLNNVDKQSFISGIVYASLLTSQLPKFIFKRVDI